MMSRDESMTISTNYSYHPQSTHPSNTNILLQSAIFSGLHLKIIVTDYYYFLLNSANSKYTYINAI